MCQIVHPDVEPFGVTCNLLAKRHNLLAFIPYSGMEDI